MAATKRRIPNGRAPVFLNTKKVDHQNEECPPEGIEFDRGIWFWKHPDDPTKEGIGWTGLQGCFDPTTGQGYGFGIEGNVQEFTDYTQWKEAMEQLQ